MQNQKAFAVKALAFAVSLRHSQSRCPPRRSQWRRPNKPPHVVCSKGIRICGVLKALAVAVSLWCWHLRCPRRRSQGGVLISWQVSRGARNCGVLLRRPRVVQKVAEAFAAAASSEEFAVEPRLSLVTRSKHWHASGTECGVRVWASEVSASICHWLVSCFRIHAFASVFTFMHSQVMKFHRSFSF